MKTKCYKCKYEWNYKGKQKFYITCPSCYSKLSLKKIKKIKEEKEK